MDTTAPPKKAPKAAQAPLSPVAAPGRIRYGLMNPKGEYFVHPYQLDGKWHEWHLESYDAVAWVDFDSVHDAAKTFNALHIEHSSVLVVKL
jgi:hypothetical protein